MRSKNTEIIELKKRVEKLESESRRGYFKLIISVLINLLDEHIFSYKKLAEKRQIKKVVNFFTTLIFVAGTGLEPVTSGL